MSTQPPTPDQPSTPLAHVPWARPLGAAPADDHAGLPIAHAAVPIAYAPVPRSSRGVTMDFVWAWISIALFVACSVLFILSSVIGAVLVGMEDIMDHLGTITAAGEVLTMGLIPVGIVFVARGSLRREFHLHRVHATLVLAVLPVAAVLQIATQLMSQYLGAIFPPDLEHIEAINSLTVWDSPLRAAIVILQIALVPAVCEELLFRGLLLSGLRRLMGDWAAVLVVGSLFAAVHVIHLIFAAPAAAASMMIPYTFLGLSLTVLTVRTGTIVYSAILHFANNFLALLMVNCMSEAFMETWMSNGVAMAVLSPIALALLVWWMTVAGRHPNPSYEHPPVDDSAEAAARLIAPAVDAEHHPSEADESDQVR